MESVVSNYWPFILSIIALAVWLVRLEGKTDSAIKATIEAQKDIDDLRIRHEGLDTKIVEQLARVRESLARLEGYFSAKAKDPFEKQD
jgi:hypothetical protein